MGKEIRGFKILKSTRKKGISLKLFAQNGKRFVVMFTRYYLGFPIKRKRYEFDDLEQAQSHYDKLIYRKISSSPLNLF